MARNHHLTQKDQNPVNNVSLNLVQELQMYKKSRKTEYWSLKLAHTRLWRRHTHASIVDGALLDVEILNVICGKYILQLIKKLLISCLTKTYSAHTVLTILIIVVIWRGIFLLTLERSHTLAQNVGSALLSLQIAVDICRKNILQLIRRLLVSKFVKTDYTSVHTVLTLTSVALLWNIMFILILEKSHTLAGNVGGALLNLQISLVICAQYILRKLQPAHLEVSCQFSHTGEKLYTYVWVWTLYTYCFIQPP